MSVAASKSTTASPLFRGPELTKATFASKTEEMCGDVILEGPDKLKRYVHLKVYRTSLEHFAVVYPLKRLSKPMGIINIRNTCVTPVSTPSALNTGCGAKSGFVINQRMFDVNTSVTLWCEPAALPAWANAFASRSSPALIHQTSLPCVQEEDSD